MMKKASIKTLLTLVLATLPLPGLAAETQNSEIGILDDATAKQAWGERSYSPYVGRSYPTRVFWGDTHLHTALSVDSTVFGSTLELESATALPAARK
jgi:hypothetical protein